MTSALLRTPSFALTHHHGVTILFQAGIAELMGASFLNPPLAHWWMVESIALMLNCVAIQACLLMAVSRWISGSKALEKPLSSSTSKLQSLAMAERTGWGQRIGGASGKDFGWNIAISRALLVIFWIGAFLLPWLLLASACMLKVSEALIGKELQLGRRSRATP